MRPQPRRCRSEYGSWPIGASEPTRQSSRKTSRSDSSRRWPEVSFQELIRLAFRGGKLIDNFDHPVIRQIGGCEMLDRLPYRYINAVDCEYEFGGVDGNRPRPVCMVARELRTGQTWRIWRGEFGSQPPFPIGPDALFVSYSAPAELGCFRQLGWPMPARILDLFCEYLCLINGRGRVPGEGDKLVNALAYFSLDTITVQEKRAMIDLILTGGPWRPPNVSPSSITAKPTWSRWSACCPPCCRGSTWRGHCSGAAMRPRCRAWSTPAFQLTHRYLGVFWPSGTPLS